MKKCPQCGREYDNTMSFCLDDGSELLYGPAKSEPPAVAVGLTLQSDLNDEPQTAILSEPGAVATGFRGGEDQTRQHINTTDQTAVLRTGAEAEPQGNSSDLSEKQSFSANRVAKPLLIALGLAVIVLGGFFGYRYFSPAKQINSIAVMPFENRNSDADTDYLSDGLAESLIFRLTQIPDLRVSPDRKSVV